MLPLDDIRVLDLTRLAPGPHCTMLLADMGANVVRIEEPGGGRRASIERARHSDADRSRLERRRSAFSALDRNKRSLALNLKVPEARAAFFKLVEGTDVLVEGYRPGVASRLGIDFPALSALNPRLIYCSITGYGQDGPYRGLVGHDVNYAAMAGALSIIGRRDGPPVIPANLLGDYAGGGMHAAIGILIALHARSRTGRGQFVDISMTDGVLTLLAAALSESQGSETPIRRGAHRLNGGNPYYNVYPCADGKFISVGANEEWFYDNLCQALGLPELAGTQADQSRYAEVTEAFAAAFATRGRDEWFEQLRDKDVCAAPVLDLDELGDNPQLRERGMIVDLPHSEFGAVRQIGISIKLSETPGSIRKLASARGADGREVLREFGLAEEAIEELERAGGTEF